MLVSCVCCNTLLQTWRFKTTETYSFIFVEIRSSTPVFSGPRSSRNSGWILSYLFWLLPGFLILCVSHSAEWPLCDLMNCSLPGFSGHGILQARILVWIAIFFSRGSFWPRDQTWISRIAGRFFTIWAIGKSSPYLGSTLLQSLPPSSLWYALNMPLPLVYGNICNWI